MIRAKAFTRSDNLIGFEISGHSGYADEGEDIVCAAVSSCAYMVVNTLTDVLNIDLDIELEDGFMTFLTKTNEDAVTAQVILKGLLIHLEQLSLQYPDNVKLETTEVKQ